MKYLTTDRLVEARIGINPDTPMDDSRVLAAGGVGKRKKAKKNGQSKPVAAATQNDEQPQPVQEVRPIQEVHLGQSNIDDMLMDNPFGSNEMHPFSEHFQAVHEMNMETGHVNTATIMGQINRISLEDPDNEILERGGSSASQIWSTSAFFNNFPFPDLPVDRVEECVALTALKMRLYSLQLRESRLTKERI